MFYILACVSIGGGVLFAILGSGEAQPFTVAVVDDSYRKVEEAEPASSSTEENGTSTQNKEKPPD